MTEPMRDRFYRVAAQLLDEDSRIALVLSDIGVSRLEAYGIFERHPERAINIGIREALMVSAAAGMALEGMRPIVHSYTPFLVERAFEQIKLDICHQAAGGILVGIGASYDTSEEGRTHQAPEDVALLAALPDFTIHVPGHPDEVEGLLRAAAARDDAVYIRLSEAENADPHLGSDSRGVTTLRSGSQGSPTILAVGPMLDPVLQATADLDATVLYTHTPCPLDAGTLRGAVTGTDVVVAEPYGEGTSAGAVTAALSDRPIRLLSIGVPNVETRRYGTAAEHDHFHRLDAAGLRARLEAWL
jgi:transketolase